MASNLDLKFKISTVGADKAIKAFKASNAEIKKLNKEVNKTGSAGSKSFKKSTESVKQLGSEVKRTNSFLTSTKGLLTGFFGIAAGTALASSVLDVNREMESLRAQLKSLTGSSSGASQAFSFIQDFAKDTPFQIQGLTKTFIDLQNFGINPTAQVMGAITNQASKLGASQETLSGITLALGQAYAKGKLQAEEMLQLVERGVPVYKILAEATGRNTSELSNMASKGLLGRDVIDQLIVKMGELAAGSNADAMNTLNGTISNLSDSWVRFQDTLLGDKSEGLIKSFVSSVGNVISSATNLIGSSLDNQLSKAEARIRNFEARSKIDQIIISVGFDIEGEKRRVRAIKALKEEEKEISREMDKQSLSAKNLTQELEKTKAIEDERAAQLKTSSDLADSAIKNLQREIALRKDSSTEAAIQYDITFGRLKDISALEKQRLLTLAAQKDALRGVADAYKKSDSVADGGSGATSDSGRSFGQPRTTRQVLDEIGGKSLKQIQEEVVAKQKVTDSNNALLQERLRFNGQTDDPRFNPDFQADKRFSDSSLVKRGDDAFKAETIKPPEFDRNLAIDNLKSLHSGLKDYLEAHPLIQTIETIFVDSDGGDLDNEALAGGTR